MTDPPTVAVVVVTMNGVQMLRRCLASIAAQTRPADKVVVVDNGATDDIAGMLQQEFADACYIREDTNTGFAAGNNRGIEATNTDYVALINNDAVAEPGWLVALLDAAEHDSSIGAVGSVIIDGNDPSRLDSCGVAISADGMSRQAMRGAVVPGPFATREILAMSGCACLLRMESLRQVGLFDERFFAYCEDTDLALRMRRAGWQIVVAGTARVTHYYSRTSGPFSLRKIFWVERNHFWVVAKNFPLAAIVLLPLSTIMRYAIQLRSLFSKNDALHPFISKHGFFRIAGTHLLAHISAIAGLPTMIARRIAFRPPQRIPSSQMKDVLSRFRLSAREIIGSKTE